MLPALLLPLLAFATTALAVPTKRDLMTDHEFTSPGHEGLCIRDSVHERVFKGAYEGSHEGMSWHRCSNFCYNKGFQTFGVEYGGECFCGNKHDIDHKEVLESKHACNMACTGDRDKKCGGSNALLVFHTTKALPKPLPVRGTPVPGFHAWQYQDQCNADDPNHPLLHFQFKLHDMTWAKCVDKCERKKFNLAGISSEGTESSCFCGDAGTFNHRHPAGSDQCKTICPNTHPLQVCGGHNALSIIYRGGVKY